MFNEEIESNLQFDVVLADPEERAGPYSRDDFRRVSLTKFIFLPEVYHEISKLLHQMSLVIDANGEQSY